MDGKSSEELVIDRLTKVQNPNEVFEWIKQVKQARIELSDFMDFMAHFNDKKLILIKLLTK